VYKRQLFLAGILPGLILGAALMVVVHVIAVRRGYAAGSAASWGETAHAAVHAALPLLTPVIIIGGIWSGIFTPTEAGAVAVLWALLLGVAVYRTIGWREAGTVLYESALASANILFIIAVSAFISWLLTMEQVPLRAAVMIVDWSPHPFVFLLLLNLVLLILGCFMPSAPILIMLTPIILPAAVAMGIDPVHLGIVMVFNLMLGLITPPVGLCIFAVAEVAGISPVRLVWALLPFFIPLVVVLLLITAMPGISLLLPRLFGFTS
jgi:tripartite ATP-independent transporter DctM subunit